MTTELTQITKVTKVAQLVTHLRLLPIVKQIIVQVVIDTVKLVIETDVFII